jgi:hypothetical protein
VVIIVVAIAAALMLCLCCFFTAMLVLNASDEYRGDPYGGFDDDPIEGRTF